MRRWTTVAAVAAVCAAVLPALPAAADDPVAIELVSGPGTAWTRDSNTDMSFDGGSTWQDAWLIPRNAAYSLIPGTSWLSDQSEGWQRQNVTTLFRRTFELPATARDATLRVCLHADNGAVIDLNTVVVGAQPAGMPFGNFQGEPECFDAPGGSLVEGTNVLLFTVRNYDGPMGLDYRATLTYAERVDEPPVLQTPGPLTVEAAERSGATVEFEATATDPDGGDAAVVCDPPSGSVFPVGTTAVECTATDDEGTTSTGAFDVTVTYTNRPPVLAQPDDIVVETDSRTGAPVQYELPGVTDDGVGPASVDCTPASGSVFPVGTAPVTCVATDDEGLRSQPVSFDVTVVGPVQRACSALDAALTSTALSATLRAAADALAAGGYTRSATSLRSVAVAVAPYDGRRLSVTLAALVRSWLQRIDVELGCP